MENGHQPLAESIDVQAGRVSCNQVGEPDEIDGSIALVTGILDDLVRGMDWDTFETAVCLLNEAIEEETDPNNRAEVRGALVKTLLTRFACFGWNEDRLMLHSLWADDLQQGRVMIRKCLERSTSDTLDVVQLAVGLIDDVRKSIDKAVLGTAIYVASEVLDSGGDPAKSRHRLQVMLGRALVIGYLQGGSTDGLEEAEKTFQDADIARGANDPWAYIRAVSLEHIGWTRYVEQGMAESLNEGVGWLARAVEEDKQGREQFEVGSELLEGGEFEAAIPFLFNSLHRRAPPHPNRPNSLNNLAIALFTRFNHRGSLEDLEQSIVLHKEALGLRPSRHPQRSVSLSNLANVRMARFEYKPNLGDLEECLGLHREALSLRPSPHPDRSTSLNGLGNALRNRFDINGNFEDLEECIVHHREALGLRPYPHPDRADPLNDLAGALLTRFRHKGSFDNLEECIVLQRESLRLKPSPHPHRHASLTNLGNALWTQFERKGNLEYLEECLLLHREALGLLPPPHHHRSGALTSLANALCTRSKHNGSFNDLEECIVLHMQALALMTPPHAGRSGSLNNLAMALFTLFEHTGRIEDLEDCIVYRREALRLMPHPHPNRYRALNNLATALSIRFKHRGSFDDHEECIVLHREALESMPPPHPGRSSSLNNLAIALFTLSEHKGSSEDLEECIKLHREALELTPSPNPERCISLQNLAIALHRAYHYSHDEADLDSALDLLKAAAEYSTAPLMERLFSANRWALFSRQNHRTSAFDAYSYLITLLPLLSSLDLTLSQRQNVLVHTKNLSNDAAQCAISQNALQTAVVFLSTSRSVFWSQALQLRSPLDLLDSVNPSLARDLRKISQRLEQAANHTSTLDPISHPHSDKSETLYSLSQQREQLLAKAREIDGFQDFLLPPSFDSLGAAARNGPIVFLNASQYGCDAIIMRPGGQLEHVALGVELAMLQTLSTASQQLAQQQFIRSEIVEEITEHLKCRSSSDTRLKGRIKCRPGTETIDDDFRFLLESLWTVVVKPIVDSLGLLKTEAPTRLWWCATGVFSFLPIHAAGSYSKTDGPEDALFQYASSSYIYTTQDLISPPPALTSDFKMVAVIEPMSGSGYNALPMTKVELEKIRAHIPAYDNLIEHIGKEKEATNLDDVLSNLKECSLAHFGCHGTQHPSNPLASALVLSGGRLTMERIIQKCQASNGCLAYLSACQTAKSDEERPDEALTLAATMLFAGFRGVVGTMWSISDVDAPVVADVFYKHMFRNGTECPPDVSEAAYALHLAVQKIRDSGASFWNWVPYIHFGV
ncbi:hypothetical protein FA15DRAFT_705213 [Coprinopsis marcescibilis]|uniref:CHAT domain-containing protein n=1 Tax=Coprinopsis marcescibilis TaxID=230819 RepID=A0A5C3KTY5_COPMA|nr:hypothetical protein FA15DRAFT_705213 [Coprinopsis marcescibilis]